MLKDKHLVIAIYPSYEADIFNETGDPVGGIFNAPKASDSFLQFHRMNNRDERDVEKTLADLRLASKSNMLPSFGYQCIKQKLMLIERTVGITRIDVVITVPKITPYSGITVRDMTLDIMDEAYIECLRVPLILQRACYSRMSVATKPHFVIILPNEKSIGGPLKTTHASIAIEAAKSAVFKLNAERPHHAFYAITPADSTSLVWKSQWKPPTQAARITVAPVVLFIAKATKETLGGKLWQVNIHGGRALN